MVVGSKKSNIVGSIGHREQGEKDRKFDFVVAAVVAVVVVVVGLGIVGIAEGVAEHLKDKRRVPLWFC